MTGSRRAKNALFDTLATPARALSNGRRAELVDVLNQGPRSVETLAHEIGQSVANTSQHLRVLLEAGLVTTRRDGNRVIYSLASPDVGALWAQLQAVAGAHAARLDEAVHGYLGQWEELEVVSREELGRRMASAEVVLLDTRPRAEFDAGHIPGAVNAPPGELEAMMRDLPADAAYVAYCRGPFCVMADNAVRTLLAAGRDARRLEGGWPEWRDAERAARGE